jgi:hypothetical protein
MSEHPVRLIVIGFFLVLAGAVFPLLMVSQILESTFLLNFFSYAASVAGLFLGIIGGALYVRKGRKPDKD